MILWRGTLVAFPGHFGVNVVVLLVLSGKIHREWGVRHTRDRFQRPILIAALDLNESLPRVRIERRLCHL